MKYTHRTLEEKFLRMNDFFKVLLVTGARQVGKTTMLRHLAEGTDRTYVTLDNYAARDLARRDPALFLQTYPPPVLIDEIQKAPGLTEQIKFIVDANESPGQAGNQKLLAAGQVRPPPRRRRNHLHVRGTNSHRRNESLYPGIHTLVIFSKPAGQTPAGFLLSRQACVSVFSLRKLHRPASGW